MKYLWPLNGVAWCSVTILNILSAHYYAAFFSLCCVFYCYGIYRAFQQRDYWRARWAVIAKEEPRWPRGQAKEQPK